MGIDEDVYEEPCDIDEDAVAEIRKYTERLKDFKPSIAQDLKTLLSEDVPEVLGPTWERSGPGSKNFESLVKKVAGLASRSGEAAHNDAFMFINRPERLERAKSKLAMAHRLLLEAHQLLRDEALTPSEPLPKDTPIGCEHDDPLWDATDFAHAAWWRGSDHAAEVFCRKVNEVLDGKDSGSGSGYEPWESTRRRLLALVTKS